MEQGIGHDFSRVRVHTGELATRSAQSVNALAYTVGDDIVFGRGQYAPGTSMGRSLIAHELAHVVQQTAGRLVDSPRVQRQPSQEPGEPPPAGELTLEMRKQIARQLREAMAGWGTDEDSIYSALSGRTERQIEEIKKTYQETYKGRDLEADLRDELNDSELGHLAAIAPTAAPLKESKPEKDAKKTDSGTEGVAGGEERTPQQSADSVAAQLNKAMDRWGTDEEAIFSALTGRPESERTAIKEAYQRLTHRELEADLRDELSGVDLQRAMALLNQGILAPEDQVRVATAGLGTDEDLLFAALESIKGDLGKINNTIDAYREKGYGDMLDDIQDDLSGSDLDRAMELLHGATTSTGSCSADERSQGLVAIDTASSLARNAVSKLNAAVAKGSLAGRVKDTLEENFNQGGDKSGVTMEHARQVSLVLSAARAELLSRNKVTCSTPNPMPCSGTDDCAAEPDCKQSVEPKTFTVAWTCPTPGSIVRLCKAFFVCGFDQAVSILHEFVHHSGIDDKSYKASPGFKTLKPLGDHSKQDSLDNADSYAKLAKELS